MVSDARIEEIRRQDKYQWEHRERGGRPTLHLRQQRHDLLDEIDRLKAELAEAQTVWVREVNEHRARTVKAEAELAGARSLPLEIENDIRKAERQRCVGIIDAVINNPAYKHCLLTLSGILDSIEKLTP